MPRALLALIVAGFIIYGLVDCILADRSRVRAMPKIIWFLLILIVPVVGAALWLIFGKPRYGAGPVASAQRPRTAPDDDPAFLRSLDVAREQQERESRLRAQARELAERERRLREQERRSGPESGPDSTGPNAAGPGSLGPDSL